MRRYSEGAHAVNLMLVHAGAKQRKAVLKALKGQVGRIVRDEHAAVSIMCLLDSVDDTQLLAKAGGYFSYTVRPPLP